MIDEALRENASRFFPSPKTYTADIVFLWIMVLLLFVMGAYESRKRIELEKRVEKLEAPKERAR